MKLFFEEEMNQAISDDCDEICQCKIAKSGTAILRMECTSTEEALEKLQIPKEEVEPIRDHIQDNERVYCDVGGKEDAENCPTDSEVSADFQQI